MFPEHGELSEALERALCRLGERRGEEFAATIRSIVNGNWKQFCSYVRNRSNGSVDSYVNLIESNYDRLSPFLYALQADRSEVAWTILMKQLQSWTNHDLRGRGFRDETATSQLAEEYATEAAIELLTSRFPYQSDFEPWAYGVTRNTCSRLIREALRKRHIPAALIGSFDEESLNLPNAWHQDEHNWEQLRQELGEAIDQLPREEWREVIIWRYLDGLSLPEVAAKIGKSQNAVSIIKYKALLLLRSFLYEKWNVYE